MENKKLDYTVTKKKWQKASKDAVRRERKNFSRHL